LKAADTNYRAKLTSVAMADFTCAIVVPLASPIPPVATLEHDTRYTLRPLISSELRALYDFRMVFVERGVNRSIGEYTAPWCGAFIPMRQPMCKPASIRH
jgi:hypothetical protein